ncbi:DUF5666 domain-containing protein [Roseateles cellulosilyticus]|uniref:DUF5666 domain-containing protein n=1 Tax=Pelomonas cellulosilytica TaxID=2906762 RepID=A0ABS8Y2L9_9BURK|nr:DUF5666 domain-containing protein [Pelomonas sp. P8]MCE4556155.1 DUF5666 domain-containing protein [Pelomonas sp. P8]
MQKLKRNLQWAACAATCAISTAVLVACGGGGGGGDTATQAPATPAPGANTASVVDGTITGFGSVVIDGQRFDDSLVKVAFANNPDAQTAGTLGDLHTGMRVHGELKDGLLQNLVVNFALVGTVGAVDAAGGTLTVFGQTIKTTATGQLPTVFDGFNALGQLTAGDLVKVSGTVASDGSITATRIERKAKDSTELFRVSGAVQDLDTTAKTFTLTGNSSVTVNYANAKLQPTGVVIEKGKLVSVVATSAPAASGGKNVLTASVVEVKARKLPDSSDSTVGGPVTDFQSLANLRIGDVVVDASTATLKDGTTPADVANGAQALAHGTVKDGAMKADWVKVFKNDTAIKALLVGQVTDFVSLGNFTLRGTVVDASAARFTKGATTDVAAGAWVQVTGQLTPAGVKATEIAVQPPPADKPQRLAGAITAVNADTKTFTLLGTTVKWTDTTKISPDGKTLASLAAGLGVAVEGSYSEATGVFTATSVTVVSTPGVVKTIGFSGVAFNVTDTSLQVGSFTVQITPNTQLQPAGTQLADLVNGSRLSIKATVSGTGTAVTLTAIAIELQKPEKDDAGNEYVYLGGLVNDFVSAGNFKVGSQKVDASGSSVKFIDGDATKLANGLKVEIKGSVKDGVLVARQVHFMPG